MKTRNRRGSGRVGSIVVCLLLAAAATGCPTGPAAIPGLSVPPLELGPDGVAVVTERNREAVLYAFYAATPGSAQAAAAREGLLAFQLAEARRSMEERDALDVGRTLREAVRLFEPSELEAGIGSRGLRELLEWIAPVARSRGRPEDAVAAAHARLLLDPGDAGAEAEVREIEEWLVTSAEGDEAEAIERQVELYLEATARVPSPALIRRTIDLVLERSVLGPRPRPLRSMEDLQRSVQRDQLYFAGLTITVLGMAVRMGDPLEAERLLEPFRGDPGYLDEVLEEVSGLADPVRRADAGMDLAEALEVKFPEEARTLCTILRRENPSDGRPSACLGRYFVAQEEYGVAGRFFLEATGRAPRTRAFAESALRILAGQIELGLDRSDWADLQDLHRAFAAVLERFRASWPGADPPVEPDRVLEVMAGAALVAGEVETARALFAESLERLPSPGGFFEYGQMEARAGNTERALELLRRGLDASSGTLEERLLARARTYEEIGVIDRSRGDDPSAAFEQADRAWRELARNGLVTRARADVQGGILMVRVGRREEGLRRIALGIETAGRDEFGAAQDVPIFNVGLSFLHMEGARDELAVLLPAVVTRGDIDISWRVYYLLWTLGADRLDGVADDPEALAFLRAVQADGWTGTLARFYDGSIPFDEALAAARTIGQRTELYYYEGLNRLGAGDVAGATELLDRVVASRIYNYLEWEMANRVKERFARQVAASASR
jgi:tetratricopeptide (TPR) repeat protein